MPMEVNKQKHFHSIHCTFIYLYFLKIFSALVSPSPGHPFVVSPIMKEDENDSGEENQEGLFVDINIS